MEEPVKPAPEDCCNSGCNPCILDVYEDQLKAYKKQLFINNKPLKRCLWPTKLSEFHITQIKQVSKDAFLFTFENQKPDLVPFEPGQYFMLKAKFLDEEFSRAYTPLWTENGSFTALIKIYEIGEMSRYLKRLKVGSKTQWRGPYGDFKLNINQEHMLLVAQGIGIAPFYSIIKTLLDNEECFTFIKLFYCCKSSSDIYLREELSKFQAHWNFTYEVFLSQANAPIEVKYNEVVHQNRLNSTNLRDFLNDKNTDNLQILLCGSNVFIQQINDLLVDEVKCEPKCIVKF